MATVSRLRRLTRRVPKRQASSNADPTIAKLLSKSVIKPHIQQTYEDAMRRPANVRAKNSLAYEPSQCLHSLLPLLAKGFGRNTTKSGRLLCALYALEGSLKAAQDLVGNPNTLNFGEIRDLWRSDRFKALREKAIREQPWDWSTSNIIYQERVKGLKSKNFLSQEELTMILSLINEDLKTNYQLGIITTSALPSATMLCGQDPSMPVLWIHNRNNSHWEMFVPIGKVGPVKDTYLLADQIERAIRNGVYLVLNPVTADPDGNLAASQGEFLHEIDWPVGEPAREGWVSVINSDSGFGLIELKNLEKIERTANTPRIPVGMDDDPNDQYESISEPVIERSKRSASPTRPEGQPNSK